MEEDVPDMLRDFLLDLTRTGTPAKKKLAASLLKSSTADGCRPRAVFGPRLTHTDVWSRDGVLLQTASKYSRPVDMYGLCGTRLIDNCVVEETEVWSCDEVLPRKCPDNSCPADIDGCSMHVLSSCSREHSLGTRLPIYSLRGADA
jgi:hypothetical protein